jgi:hypothetical protein
MTKFLSLTSLAIAATIVLSSDSVHAQAVYDWGNLSPAVDGNLSTAAPTVSCRFYYHWSFANRRATAIK